MQFSLPEAQRGFFGKIPARGDFVRAGLPTGFVAAWDDWLQHMLSGSRKALGEDWQPAWMEAPIWRFLLQPGVCGPDAALGVFMPSVDRAGRLFPLTLAWIAPRADAFRGGGSAWLQTAETAGLAALEQDLEPDALMAALQATPSGTEDTIAAQAPPGACSWWTEGSPRVPATAFATQALPDAGVFTRMLDAEAAATDIASLGR
jgi:type VI secretion system protein ImpM